MRTLEDAERELAEAKDQLEHERVKYDQLEKERDSLLAARDRYQQRCALLQLGLDGVNGPKIVAAETRVKMLEEALFDVIHAETLDQVREWANEALAAKEPPDASL